MKAQLLILFSENCISNYTTITATKRLFSFVNQGMDSQIREKRFVANAVSVCAVEYEKSALGIFNKANRREKNN